MEYSSCLCFGNSSLVDPHVRELYALGYGPGNQEAQNQMQRYLDVKAASKAAFPNRCFICKSLDDPVVYVPCEFPFACDSPGIQNFRPAQDFRGNCMLKPNPPAEIVGSFSVRSRRLVRPLYYGIASSYLIIGFCCFLCVCGYATFMDKWFFDESGKLTRTEECLSKLCKIAPLFAHVANFVGLIMIIVYGSIVFGSKVCETASNEFGEMTFFSEARRIASGTTFIWCFGTIYGTLVNKHMPRDTYFYNPSSTRDNLSWWERFISCLWDITVKVGP